MFDEIITIDYLLTGESIFRRITLSPQDYLDGKYIEEGDQFDDCIPLYNNVLFYIKPKYRKKVVSSLLKIVNIKKKTETTVTVYYWNNQKNSLSLSLDYVDGLLTDSEVILCITTISSNKRQQTNVINLYLGEKLWVDNSLILSDMNDIFISNECLKFINIPLDHNWNIDNSMRN